MARQRYVLAVDQGTTSTRAVLARREAQRARRGPARSSPSTFPKPGLVEHDLKRSGTPPSLHRQARCKQAKAKGSDIAAIGITNQRETTGLWTNAGKPLHRAIVWQDRRTSELCQELKAKGEERACGRPRASCSTRTSRAPSSSGCSTT
jgi:glycerol kinase